MDESCIEQIMAGDPSENGKYLGWMLLQAGGGTERLEKSIGQWEKGDHGEQAVRDTLRKQYIDDAVAGYNDDTGQWVGPITEAEAESRWTAHEEEFYRNQHVYGDEEYALTGFGFYRSWPGHNNLYEQIVQAVSRFHRYQQKLKSLGKSVDLNAASYPNLRNLQEALADITFLEVKDCLEYDCVYEDKFLIVICPLNIGASVKFGHQKWCTANESMFKQACAGTGPNRWKEYAKDSGLYYCRFKKAGKEVAISQIAIQAPFLAGSAWKCYDIEDVSHSTQEAGNMVAEHIGGHYRDSFEEAAKAVRAHHANFPKTRLSLEFVVK